MLNSTVKQLASDLAAKRVSSIEVTQYFINRIKLLGGVYNAFISIDEEKSLAAARAADQLIAAGKAKPLTGIPLAHKDALYVRSHYDGITITIPGNQYS